MLCCVCSLGVTFTNIRWWGWGARGCTRRCRLMHSAVAKSLFTRNSSSACLHVKSRHPCVAADHFPAAHRFCVEMFGRVHPLWMKLRPARLHGRDVRASALLLTHPLEVIFIASHFIFPDIWKTTQNLFLTGLFSPLWPLFKCAVKTILSSFCALFQGRGAKMSFSVNVKCSAGLFWTPCADRFWQEVRITVYMREALAVYF